MLFLRGSAGQGAFLLRQIKKPLTVSRYLEIVKNKTLYFDSIIKKEKLDNNPASTAPAPKTTKRAGSAQQNKVPKLVKSESEGSNKFLLEIGFIFINWFEILILSTL